jgi:hypothetical protein
VKSIAVQDAKLGPSVQLDITILTSDASLFCDTNKGSHKTGVDKFWKQVTPFFRDAKVGRIQIVFAKTGSLASSPVNKENTLDEDGGVSIGANTDDDSSLKRNHEMIVTNCVHAIQAQMAARANADYEARRHLANDGDSPVDITFSAIDNSPVGYQYLSRQIVRDSLLVQGLRGRLELDLPETLDGTQCAVSLDVSYQVFPFAVDSPESKRLSTDLQALASSKMEVVQLVPLSSIDASLLFGLPMQVRAALVNDFNQFQEMEVLVRSLFRLLCEREWALLLRHSSAKAMDGSKSGLFDFSEQTFILMGKELPKTVSDAPNSGVLYHYANADQLLADPTATSKTSMVDDEMESQYVDYVERALECLECNPVNPLHMDATTTHTLPAATTRSALLTPPSSKRKKSCDDPVAQGLANIGSPQSAYNMWNDAAGVGSRGPVPTQNQSDDEDMNDAAEEDYTGFDY